MSELPLSRVCACIAPHELAEAARALVACPSHEDHGTAEVCGVLGRLLQRDGIEVDLQSAGDERRLNLLARAGPAGEPPFLLLNGHLDTVAPSPGEAQPWIEGGRLYGRGSTDMKGAVAAMAMALVALARAGADLRRGVMLAAVADEEVGGGGTRAFLERGGRAEMAVVGEPTGLRPVIAHKGVEWLKIEIEGVAAHASRPEQGVSAVAAAASTIKELEALAQDLAWRPRHPLLGTPTLSVGAIHGGTVPNVVPDRCVLTLDRRRLPGESAPAVVREIEAALARALSRHPGTSARVGPASEHPHMGPMETDPTHPIVRGVQRVLDRAGLESSLQGAAYGTDGAWLSERGIPTVVWGPGDIARAHAPGEYIELAELQEALELYVALILDICSS